MQFQAIHAACLASAALRQRARSRRSEERRRWSDATFLTTLCAMLVVVGTAMVSAGPLEDNAASKANGDMTGRAAQAQPMYRSYAPSTATGSFSSRRCKQARSRPRPRLRLRLRAAVPAPPVNGAPAARAELLVQAQTAPRYNYARPWVARTICTSQKSAGLLAGPASGPTSALRTALLCRTLRQRRRRACSLLPGRQPV